jgi:hypothetical protein
MKIIPRDLHRFRISFFDKQGNAIKIKLRNLKKLGVFLLYFSFLPALHCAFILKKKKKGFSCNQS